MKLAKSTMSKHQLAFMLWRDWVKREAYADNLMKKMMDKMLRSAGLMVYNLFTRWKLDTFNDIERRRTLLRNRKLNAFMECLDHKHRNHLKSGFNAIAGDSMNTATKQRIIGKLGNACFGRVKAAFDSWKYDTFAKMKSDMERKKAMVIDTLVRNNMSPFQQMFLRWAKWMRDSKMHQYGQRAKASYILLHYLHGLHVKQTIFGFAAIEREA